MILIYLKTAEMPSLSGFFLFSAGEKGNEHFAGNVI